MITYNDIYEALRKERYSEQLQQLSKNFVVEVAGYLKDKKEITGKEENIFSDSLMKNKKQLENAISIFKELMLRRKKKLLHLAFIAAETGISKRDFETMLEFEKQLFDKIMNAIDESEKQVAGTLNGKEEIKKEKKLVKFNENVEEFLGLAGEQIGPFEKGEIANLPEEIASILVSSEKAEMIGE